MVQEWHAANIPVQVSSSQTYENMFDFWTEKIMMELPKDNQMKVFDIATHIRCLGMLQLLSQSKESKF